MTAFLESALRDALGAPSLRLTDQRGAQGGCISHAVHLSTTSGPFFAKWNADAPADLFLREADGLNALRRANSQIRFPRVVAASAPTADHPAFLILEELSPIGQGGARHEEDLGRGLATIHRLGSAAFGFATDTYCGATRQDNRASDSWIDFYRERRILALVDALEAVGRLSADDRRRYERLADRLAELLGHDPVVSLIHGDLWAGNVLATATGPALIDPACAFADREMDFGIATLFGGLSARAMAAYQEAWPLPPGWRERNGLYQLYHLLNHALLFGGGYVAQARDTARRYVGAVSAGGA